ncbi:MAG: PD-(D/E)XK nuclease family protein, partial [Tepidiformaceae bacterium]
VLRVREREDPEDILVLNAAERGTIIHETLDRFMKTNAGWEGAWQPHHLEQILAMGDARCQQAEEDGITGKPLLWNIERQRIRRDLEGFLEADAERRALGYQFVAGEHPFGMGPNGHGPLRVQLSDGSAIAFRGRIDRIDRNPQTGALAVYDYKSGRTTPYKDIDNDHLKSGELLQLPIYALAAAQAFGEDASTWASYWFVTRQGEYEHKGYLVGPDDLAEFGRMLNVIANGIGGGVFPANPGLPETRYGGSTNCNFCPYKGLCPSDRQPAWRRKQSSPESVEYLQLANKAVTLDDD